MNYKKQDIISIHAPPRGATVSRSASPAALPFQFTPLREGRRMSSGAHAPRPRLFQFTPLREGRRRSCPCTRDRAPFQFTPLREGRPGNPAERRNNHISIHAPPRGATGSGRRVQRLPFHFNSRPSARGDHQAPDSGRLAGHFNSRPSARGDALLLAALAALAAFQFTPLREGRHLHGAHRRTCKYFNSRPSARGDGFFSF